MRIASDIGGTFTDLVYHDERTGELDLATAPKLQRKVDGTLREDPPAVLVIDLSAVTFLASAGMAVLVAAHRRSGTGTRVRVAPWGSPIP